MILPTPGGTIAVCPRVRGSVAEWVAWPTQKGDGATVQDHQRLPVPRRVRRPGGGRRSQSGTAWRTGPLLRVLVEGNRVPEAGRPLSRDSLQRPGVLGLFPRRVPSVKTGTRRACLRAPRVDAGERAVLGRPREAAGMQAVQILPKAARRQLSFTEVLNLCTRRNCPCSSGFQLGCQPQVLERRATWAQRPPH